MNLLLFDIDGTLIHSFGAGQKAADLAFESAFGVKDGLGDIRTDGLTDPIILNKMFQRSFARNYEPVESELFYEKYLYFLDQQLSSSNKVDVLPGVFDLLEDLIEREDSVLGLGTGNIEQGAWIKLDYAGLKKYFTFGGFGSDADSRDELIRVGINKGKDILEDGSSYDNILVIGDTPLDIINGKAAGAKTVGVATGHYNIDDLKEYKPDILLNDLTEFLNTDLPN